MHVHSLDDLRNPAAAELFRTLRALGDRACGAGLDGEGLARSMGRSLGDAMARRLALPNLQRREALERAAALLEECGVGGLTVVSLTPLVLRVQPPAFGFQGRGRRCAHVAGFLEGALGALLGKAPVIKEMDCVGLGTSACTFACEL